MFNNLDIFIPGTTKVYEYIRITVVLKDGTKFDIVDELKKTTIKHRLWYVIIKGRFNYAIINKFNIGVINITVGSPQEVKSAGQHNKDTF